MYDKNNSKKRGLLDYYAGQGIDVDSPLDYENPVAIFNNFWDWIQTVCCEDIKEIFNQQWYREAHAQAKGLCDGSLKEFDGRFLPCRLYEEGLWPLFNKGIPIVAEITGKNKIIRNKLKQLKQENLGQAYSQAFELAVMCRFAVKEVIKDIDFKPKEGSSRTVDIQLSICEEPLYVEVSRMNKNLRNPQQRIATMSPSEQITQVNNKMWEKGKLGSQLEICQGPTLLVMALPERGANQFSAKWAMEEGLNSFPSIGAVLISDTHRFINAELYINSNSIKQPNKNQLSFLKSFLKTSNCLLGNEVNPQSI